MLLTEEAEREDVSSVLTYQDRKLLYEVYNVHKDESDDDEEDEDDEAISSENNNQSKNIHSLNNFFSRHQYIGFFFQNINYF